MPEINIPSRYKIEIKVKCPVCDGNRGWQEYLGEGNVLTEPCNYCHSTGSVPIFQRISYYIWEYLPVWFIELIDSKRQR
jgi:hypothetical protein